MFTVNKLLILLVLFLANLYNSSLPTSPEEYYKIQELTDSDFDHKISSDSEWIVVLYANWCSYCKRFKKELVQLSEKLQDSQQELKVQLAQVNIDENSNVASRFYVTYLPSVFYIKNRKVRSIDYSLPLLRSTKYSSRDADSMYLLLTSGDIDKITEWGYVWNPWSVFGFIVGVFGSCVGVLQIIAESSPYLSQEGVWYGLFFSFIALMIVFVVVSSMPHAKAGQRRKED